jgi:hypothetical protein
MDNINAVTNTERCVIDRGDQPPSSNADGAKDETDKEGVHKPLCPQTFLWTSPVEDLNHMPPFAPAVWDVTESDGMIQDGKE